MSVTGGSGRKLRFALPRARCYTHIRESNVLARLYALHRASDSLCFVLRSVLPIEANRCCGATEKEVPMTKPWMISRRTMLRGTGASVALPWLDSMALAAQESAASKQSGPPVRLAYFYVPNGVNMADWKPKDEGDLGELPPTLRSLEPVKNKILVLSDLAAEHCNGKSAGHEPAGGGFLVGAKCKHSEEPEVGGASVDQVAAREIGLSTPVDSLALGIDPGHRGDHGYSGTYLSHISWRSKTTPAALELNPKELYDRLFRGKKLRKPDWTKPADDTLARLDDSRVEKSVLDLVREDTRALQRQLGFGDRRKLEEYLEGLRSIERRIAFASSDPESHHREAFRDAPPPGGHGDNEDDLRYSEIIIPNGRGIPAVYADHVNLMLDMLTLAFQTDITRIATFLFSYEKSGRAYSEIDARGSHHSTSHHGNKEENLAQLSRINSHHMELFSRMLVKMSEIKEGEGTLLDHVMICYGAGISDGNKHNHDNLPVLVAGGAGGSLQGGRHIAFGKKTPLCNLYVDMLQRAGIERKQFGDSTGRLDLGQSNGRS